MKEQLRGVHIPVVTPFDDDGDLRLDMLVADFERWSRTSVRGYLVLGSNGEARSLDDDDSLAAVKTAVALKGDKTVMVGVGRESLRLTLGFLDKVAALGGVDYVAVLPPGYFSPLMTQQSLIDYYLTIADASPLPVLVYNAPHFVNGVSANPASTKVIAAHPNVHGMKDSAAGTVVDYLSEVGDDDAFSVLAGSITTLMSCLVFGGSGGIVAPANFLPQQCADVTDRYFAGRAVEAFEGLAEIVRIVRVTAGPYGVAGVKCCMNLLGYSGGVPRLPVPEVPADLQALWARELAAKGYLGA